jgi:molecular chaperone DnaK (HSP70)
MNILGLRLGNTNTSAFVWCEDERTLRPVVFDHGQALLPTAVGLTTDGRWVIGQRALNLQLRDPSAVAAGFEHNFFAPHSYIRLPGHELQPRDLAAQVISEIRRVAEETIGASIRDCVLSAPSYFFLVESSLLFEAASAAGLAVRQIIPDPIASVIAAELPEQVHSALVVRMGGRGFDVASLSRRSPWSLMFTDGVANLGGLSIDQIIQDRLFKEWPGDVVEKILGDKRAYLAVLREAERAKRQLSVAAEVAVGPMTIGDSEVEGYITRREFEELIEPLINRACNIVERAVERGREIGLEDFDSLLLTGGCAHIPALRAALEATVGMAATPLGNPQLIAARGAALVAGFITDDKAKEESLLLCDVTPSPIWIEMAGGARKLIVEEGTPLPCSVTLEMRSDGPAQEFRINLWEGDRPIGEFSMALASTVPVNAPLRLEVTVDENRRVSCSLTALTTGESVKTSEPRLAAVIDESPLDFASSLAEFEALCSEARHLARQLEDPRKDEFEMFLSTIEREGRFAWEQRNARTWREVTDKLKEVAGRLEQAVARQAQGSAPDEPPPIPVLKHMARGMVEHLRGKIIERHRFDEFEPELEQLMRDIDAIDDDSSHKQAFEQLRHISQTLQKIEQSLNPSVSSFRGISSSDGKIRFGAVSKKDKETPQQPSRSIAPVGEAELSQTLPIAPAQAKTEDVIGRHTDVSFPARVRVGKPYNLRVQIVPTEVTLPTGQIKEIPKAHDHDITMSLEVPRPDRPEQPPPPIRVAVSVTAENFEIEGQSRAEIIVPLAGKSQTAIFRLIGEEVGPARIMIDFAQGGRPIGSVDLSPHVAARDQKETDEQSLGTGEVAISTRAAAAPDVVIKVFEYRLAGGPGRLHFVLYSTDPRLGDLPVMDGDLGTIDLRTEVIDWVELQLGRLAALAKRGDLRPGDVSRTLCDVGNDLYDQLLPRALRDLCWTFRKRGVRTMLILSDEPHIPWELIKPYRANAVTGELEAEDDFWGESFALTHWIRGRPPADHLSLNRIFAFATGGASESRPSAVRDFVPQVANQAGLKAVDEELSMLRALEGRGARVNVLPARMQDLRRAFESGGFDLLHLASHGAFGGLTSADASAVLMEDGAFSAMELSPRMAVALRRASPLVFFNSCHSGRMGFSLTRLGSWGARLIEIGCGGFVGSLWPVTDEAALAFARAFYAAMCQGTPIGEAMLKARLAVRESYPDDPTWLAYCCFADPMATVQSSVSSH